MLPRQPKTHNFQKWPKNNYDGRAYDSLEKGTWLLSKFLESSSAHRHGLCVRADHYLPSPKAEAQTHSFLNKHCVKQTGCAIKPPGRVCRHCCPDKTHWLILDKLHHPTAASSSCSTVTAQKPSQHKRVAKSVEILIMPQKKQWTLHIHCSDSNAAFKWSQWSLQTNTGHWDRTLGVTHHQPAMFCRRWPKVSVFKHWHMQTNTRMDFKLKILCSPTLITLSSLTPVTMDPPKHEPWIWTSHHNYLYSGSLSASTSTQHCHILCPRWHQSPRGAVTHPHHQHGECWMLARHFSDLTSDGISEDLNFHAHKKHRKQTN